MPHTNLSTSDVVRPVRDRDTGENGLDGGVAVLPVHSLQQTVQTAHEPTAELLCACMRSAKCCTVTLHTFSSSVSNSVESEM